MLARNQQREQTAERRKTEVQKDQGTPLEGVEHRIKHQCYHQQCEWNHDSKAMIGALLALIFARPFQCVAFRKLDLAVDVSNGFFYSASEIASPDAVLESDVAFV